MAANSDALEVARHKGMLESLQQQDPGIDSVIVFSKFVVAYLLQQEGPNPGWRKASIEGPLYLVHRKVNPKYQLLVKNQFNTSDLLDNLHPEWELDCQKNYVFYKVEDASKRIRGLWFHDDSERIKLETALEKTLDEIRVRLQEPEMPPPGLQHGEGSAESGRVDDEDNLQKLYAQFGLAKPPNISGGGEPQSGSTFGDSVTVSRETLRTALHALADDDSFVTTVMQKLKDHDNGR